MPSRPIPSRQQAMSFSAPLDYAPAAVLLYYLKNISAEDLHSQMLKVLKEQKFLPQDIEILALALERVGLITRKHLNAVDTKEERHCGRCHQTYVEKNNNIRACIVQHIPNAERANTNDSIYACCDTKTMKPHFVGRHTTRESKVRFNGINVLSCEQRQCGINQGYLAMPDPFTGVFGSSTATSSRARSEVQLRAPEDDQMFT